MALLRIGQRGVARLLRRLCCRRHRFDFSLLFLELGTEALRLLRSGRRLRLEFGSHRVHRVTEGLELLDLV